MEGDEWEYWMYRCCTDISIHSLRMEGDGILFCGNCGHQIFQSTPSAWRETNPFGELLHSRIYISIHSLRMEGDTTPSRVAERLEISIHSLRMEGDILQRRICGGQTISIHSLRMEGDLAQLSDLLRMHISIHSLRMEGDPIASPPS